MFITHGNSKISNPVMGYINTDNAVSLILCNTPLNIASDVIHALFNLSSHSNLMNFYTNLMKE